MSATSTLNAIIKIVKQGGGDKETISAMTKIKGAVTQAGVVMGAMAGAAFALDQAIQQTAGAFVEYETRVENTARVTGLTMEATSRLMQVMDDLFISQESFTKGMEFAIRQGYKPSVEWLEQMADKISAMKSPADQTKEAIKLFGRQAGPEMQKLMLQGKDGIDKMMASVEKGLVLTEESRQKALLYKQAMDRLGDSFEALKISIGSQVAPAVGGFIQQLVNLTSGASMAEIRLKNLIVEMEAAPIDNQTRAYMAMAQALQQTATSADEANTAQTKYVSDMQGEYSKLVGSLGQMNDKTIAVGLAFGFLTQKEIDSMVALHNFDVALNNFKGTITKQIVVQLWVQAQYGVQAGNPQQLAQAEAANAGSGGGGGGGGSWVRAGKGWEKNTATGAYRAAPWQKASGGNDLVTSPTLFMAGEAGPERVKVTPLGSMDRGGGGGDINIYLDSRLIQKTLAKNARMKGA